MTLTLSELASLTGGNIVRGGLSSFYEGIASLDEAGPADISFLGNEKYKGQFLATAAGAVLVPPGVTAGPDDAVALVTVENPSEAFARVAKRFLAALVKPFTPGVHPRAIVEDSARLGSVRIHAGAVVMAGAEIGDGCEIGPNAVIGESARLGRDCRIGAGAFVGERCLLGDRVSLQPGAVIGSDGYGYEMVDGRHVKIDQLGIVELQDDVEIGANSTVDRARFGRTIVATGTKIDNLVQIGHNVRIGRHNLIVSQSGVAGSSRTGDYVVMAAQVGVVGHVTIGDKAILTARTGVTHDLPGGQTYGGAPVRPFMDHQRELVASRQLPAVLKKLKARDTENGAL